jgi:hypothetical protein
MFFLAVSILTTVFHSVVSCTESITRVYSIARFRLACSYRSVTLNVCKSRSKTHAYVMREQIHMDCSHRDGM